MGTNAGRRNTKPGSVGFLQPPSQGPMFPHGPPALPHPLWPLVLTPRLGTSSPSLSSVLPYCPPAQWCHWTHHSEAQNTWDTWEFRGKGDDQID